MEFIIGSVCVGLISNHSLAGVQLMIKDQSKSGWSLMKSGRWDGNWIFFVDEEWAREFEIKEKFIRTVGGVVGKHYCTILKSRFGWHFDRLDWKLLNGTLSIRRTQEQVFSNVLDLWSPPLPLRKVSFLFSSPFPHASSMADGDRSINPPQLRRSVDRLRVVLVSDQLQTSRFF